ERRWARGPRRRVGPGRVGRPRRTGRRRATVRGPPTAWPARVAPTRWKDEGMQPAEVTTAVTAESTEGAEATGTGQRRPGRPRSERADRAIIDAALSVFAESGPEGLYIERVAARAGGARPAIHRRWPGKEDLLLDALGALQNPLPEPAGESVRDDLVAILSAMRDSVADPRRAREFALLLGEGAKYPRLMARYVET